MRRRPRLRVRGRLRRPDDRRHAGQAGPRGDHQLDGPALRRGRAPERQRRGGALRGLPHRARAGLGAGPAGPTTITRSGDTLTCTATWTVAPDTVEFRWRRRVRGKTHYEFVTVARTATYTPTQPGLYDCEALGSNAGGRAIPRPLARFAHRDRLQVVHEPRRAHAATQSATRAEREVDLARGVRVRIHLDVGDAVGVARGTAARPPSGGSRRVSALVGGSHTSGASASIRFMRATASRSSCLEATIGARARGRAGGGRRAARNSMTRRTGDDAVVGLQHRHELGRVGARP